MMQVNDPRSEERPPTGPAPDSNALGQILPFNNQVEAEIAVQRGARRPTGPIHLTTENASVVTDWATAAGTGSYPGKPLGPQVSL